MRTLRDVLDVELVRLRENLKPSGLPSGFGLERRVPGGVLGDKITCIFAEPGNFKTTTKNHMLLSMAAGGHRVMDASLEDLPELTAHRYMSRYSEIPYGSIAGGTCAPSDVDFIRGTLDMDIPKNIVVPPDDFEPTAENIIHLAREAKVRALAVDYVQLLEGYGGEKQVLDSSVRAFQRFAMQDKVAVILLSQQKQRDPNRSNPRPKLDDMLGSSAMRIAAKCVIGLFRPYNEWKSPQMNAKANPNSPYGMYSQYLAAAAEHTYDYPNILEAWVLKNVLGRTGAMHLKVQPETGFVENFDEAMRPYL